MLFGMRNQRKKAKIEICYFTFDLPIAVPQLTDKFRGRSMLRSQIFIQYDCNNALLYSNKHTFKIMRFENDFLELKAKTCISRQTNKRKLRSNHFLIIVHPCLDSTSCLDSYFASVLYFIFLRCIQTTF